MCKHWLRAPYNLLRCSVCTRYANKTAHNIIRSVDRWCYKMVATMPQPFSHCNCCSEYAWPQYLLDPNTIEFILLGTAMATKRVKLCSSSSPHRSSRTIFFEENSYISVFFSIFAWNVCQYVAMQLKNQLFRWDLFAFAVCTCPKPWRCLCIPIQKLWILSLNWTMNQ